MTTDARYAALTGALGLSSRDLAEIGGFSDRFARYLLNGKKPFPGYVKEALDALDKDSDRLTDEMVSDVKEGAGVILVFRSNQELRAHFPDRPGRGEAEGGFVGPYRIAALAASDILSDAGINVDLVFYDPPG